MIAKWVHVWILSLSLIIPGKAFPLDISPLRYSIEIDGEILALPYSSSHPLDVKNENIDRAIIVRHGMNLDSVLYFDAMMEAVRMVPGQEKRTIVISLQFLTQEVINEVGVESNVLYWNTWERPAWGGLSAGPEDTPPRPKRIGAFQVLERILSDICDFDIFPNLSTLVICGHSQGGQFAHHYAVVNKFEQQIAEPLGIDMRYIVMNSSKYVYFNEERAVNWNPNIFAIPDPSPGPGYNDYGWGLDNIYPVLDITVEQVLSQYSQRDVRYMVGENDTELYDPSDYRTYIQGRNTFEGAVIYWNYLQYYWGPGILEYQQMDIVPGVAHAPMFSSSQGLKHLFDYDPAPDAVFYVDDDSKNPLRGTSWEDSFSSLSEALRFARAGNEIHVAQGIYRPDPLNETEPQTACFVIPEGVNLFGGYAGIGTSNPDLRNPKTFLSILSGDLNGNDNGSIESLSDNSYNVVCLDVDEEPSLMDGFRIIGGNAASDVFPNYRGGGMCVIGGKPRIENCVFIGNHGNGGGAVYIIGADPEFIGCKFTDNTATLWDGGAVYIRESTVLFSSCEFTQNHAPYGGAIRNTYTANVTFKNCVFEKNSAGVSGGAMFSKYNDCKFLIENCLFIGNIAETDGGAIYNDDQSSGTIMNCLFNSNQAKNRYGGGICNYNSGANIINITFTHNHAGIYGGGIMNRIESAPYIANCIFWDNTDSRGSSERSQIDSEQSFTLEYSCIQNYGAVFPGNGIISQNPLFMDENGDDDIIGTEDDNFHLSIESPCIDAGKRLESVRGDFEKDSRGFDGYAGSRGDGSDWDIGYDEFVIPPIWRNSWFIY